MDTFWDFLVWLFWFYVIIACIWIFITVFIDIFRDSTLNGWGKALWVIFLVFVPFLAAFIYLIARGRGMAERNAARAAEAQAANADYIRTRGRIVVDIDGGRDREGQATPRHRRDHAGRVRRAEGEGAADVVVRRTAGSDERVASASRSTPSPIREGRSARPAAASGGSADAKAKLLA